MTFRLRACQFCSTLYEHGWEDCGLPSSHGRHPAAYAASCSSIPPLLRRLRLLRLLVDRRLVPVLRERVPERFDRLLLDFLVAISYCLLS